MPGEDIVMVVGTVTWVVGITARIRIKRAAGARPVDICRITSLLS
jgi:hypothetical protein